MVLDSIDRSFLLDHKGKKVMFEIGCSISMAICILGVIAILLWVWSNEDK